MNENVEGPKAWTVNLITTNPLTGEERKGSPKLCSSREECEEVIAQYQSSPMVQAVLDTFRQAGIPEAEAMRFSIEPVF